VSTAAWTSTGGERLASKADSPVAVVVASVNEHLAGGQVVAVPSQAQLLAFAACFGDDVVAFVEANRRIPTRGEVRKSVEMSLALDASMTGVFMTDDDGDAARVIAVADLNCASALWASKRVHFAPLLPGIEREAVFHFVPSPADALR